MANIYLNNTLAKYRLFLFLAVLLFISSCQSSHSVNKDQSKMVQSLFNQNNSFSHPVFSPNSKKILARDQENSLVLLHLENNNEEILSNNSVRDQDYGFTPDNQYVYFIENDFRQKLIKRSLTVHNLSSGEQRVLCKGKRELRVLETLSNKESSIIVYIENDSIKAYDPIKNEMLDLLSDYNMAFASRDLEIQVYQNKTTKQIRPKGQGNYLWVSLSPNRKRVLFTYSGQGSYSCDLSGNNLIEYGDIRAPKWSSDGNSVIAMADKDDGVQFTESDIIHIQADGSSRKNLTRNIDLVALFPDLSLKQDKIVFQDEKGNIYMMKID